MKVTSQSTTTQQVSDKTDRTTDDKSGATQSVSLPPERSFANVLNNVTSNSDEGRDSAPDQRSNEVKTTPVDRKPEREQTPTNEASETSPKPMPQLLTPKIEADSIQASPPAREILPSSDLENLLMAVRSQIVNAAAPQVTVDLPHSVLDGLRVKLTADRVGRITAEFSASNQTVKSHIDARSADLVEMLRFRGINVAGLKTTISADLSGNRDSNAGLRQQIVEPARARVAEVGSQQVADSQEQAEADPAARFTYRA